MYGGLEIGVGAFLLICAMRREFVRVGLLPSACALVAMATSRAVGLSLDGFNFVQALVVATEWLQYQSPDIDRLARTMKRRFVFDGRNVLSRDGFNQAGFSYRGIGRS